MERKLTPWELAREFQNEHSTKPIEDVLSEHLWDGLIYITQEVFLAAREVHWDAERQEISLDEHAEKNAWFVELAASAGHKNPVCEFMRVATRPHKWALWCRRGEMRVRAFDWNKLMNKTGGH